MKNSPNTQEWQEIESFLATRRSMSLATVSPNGTPACAPVYYCAKTPRELDFVSKYDSLHIQNINFQPNISVAIYQEGSQWTDICGLQLRGTVHPIETSLEAEAREHYMMRYPEVKSNGYLMQLFMQTPIFRFTLNWIRYCDCRHNTIRRREWEP